MTSVSVGLWVAWGRGMSGRNEWRVPFHRAFAVQRDRKRSAKQISEAVEGVGGYLNAFTSEEATCFHARACHDRLEELLDVLWICCSIRSLHRRTSGKNAK